MKYKTVTIVVFIVLILIISYCLCSNSSNSKFESYFVVPREEANLTCNLGGRKCNLQNGEPGLCNTVTRKCVELAEWENDHIRSTSPPVGEFSWDCQWRDICVRSTGDMGVCMSGWCYDSSSEAK